MDCTRITSGHVIELIQRGYGGVEGNVGLRTTWNGHGEMRGNIGGNNDAVAGARDTTIDRVGNRDELRDG